MRRLDRGPSRRERRAATKGIPRGRRLTHQADTTSAREQRDQHWWQSWQETQTEMLATRLAAAPAGFCDQCDRPIRLLDQIWVDAEDADPRCLATTDRSHRP